jgi:hypothetical protein
MKRQKKELPQEFKEQIDNLIKDLNPNACIKKCNVCVSNSIILALYNKYVQTSFGGAGINKGNIYTSGTMYSRFVKLFNNIYENSTDIRGVQIKITKVGKSWVSSYALSRTKNTDEEHHYYDYIINAIFDGETEECRIAREEYQKKKEAEKLAAQQRRQHIEEHIAYYKELNKNEVYVDLGCANGWGNKTHELVEQARQDNDCFYESENLGRCYNKYICHKYKFYYTVDSSD